MGVNRLKLRQRTNVNRIRLLAVSNVTKMCSHTRWRLDPRTFRAPLESGGQEGSLELAGFKTTGRLLDYCTNGRLEHWIMHAWYLWEHGTLGP